METVYLETTFISYLVARPSRDLLVAAHQQATEEWWTARRGEFECCISQRAFFLRVPFVTRPMLRWRLSTQSTI